MNKKGNKLKVLRTLGDGWTIKDKRIYKSEVINTRVHTALQTSSIGLYFGKKLVQGGFKNIAEAETYFSAKDAK